VTEAFFQLGTFSHPGTFSAASGAFPAVVLGERVIALSILAPRLQAQGLEPEAYRSLQDVLDAWPRSFSAIHKTVGDLARSPASSVGEALTLSQLRVHAPIPRPGSVYCSGANYKKHVVELILAQPADERTRGMSLEERRSWAMSLMDRRADSGTPFIFVKPQSSVTGPFDTIAVPDVSEKPDWELELAVIIGRRARRVPRAGALDYVAGYTNANDITLRSRVFRRKTDSPELGMDFAISKGAPGFLPLGPFMTPAAFVPDPQKLRDYMQRKHNPLPHVRSSDYDSDHATLLFRRTWVDAWLDREHERQHGCPALEEGLRQAG